MIWVAGLSESGREGEEGMDANVGSPGISPIISYIPKMTKLPAARQISQQSTVHLHQEQKPPSPIRAFNLIKLFTSILLTVIFLA